ncbi:MAG: D-sedoheptulose 7-phosphate isomerase [Acidobacteria bacterium]|nr:D-sedoheptulose 7-phosphate isomerase [Acidobacteriota bacterium]
MVEERTSRVRFSIQQNIAVKQALLADKDLVELIAAVGGEFVKALREGHKIILFGNGGSAADAQHIAAEFVGRFQLERPPLPALALTVDTSALTCIANDYQYENVFARQMMALGSKGDVAVGISTSGKSPNVLRGLDVARTKGLVTIGLTGKDSGEIGKYAQYCIAVPSEATPRIQETHILIGHILCEITDAELASR